jgi:hypothetical protein
MKLQLLISNFLVIWLKCNSQTSKITNNEFAHIKQNSIKLAKYNDNNTNIDKSYILTNHTIKYDNIIEVNNSLLEINEILKQNNTPGLTKSQLLNKSGLYKNIHNKVPRLLEDINSANPPDSAGVDSSQPSSVNTTNSIPSDGSNSDSSQDSKSGIDLSDLQNFYTSDSINANFCKIPLIKQIVEILTIALIALHIQQ